MRRVSTSVLKDFTDQSLQKNCIVRRKKESLIAWSLIAIPLLIVLAFISFDSISKHTINKEDEFGQHCQPYPNN